MIMCPTAECACGGGWIFEVCDLATGLVRTRWHPISAEWQQMLNKTARGSFTLPTRALQARDIWPGLTSVYVSRTFGADAAEDSPVAEFGGIVVETGASESGTTVVGVQSMDWYLSRRHIRQTLRLDQVPQTEIGRRLVDLARPQGIPLVGAAAPSTRLRDREWRDFNRKEIGEAIDQLVSVINGPDWELSHTKTDGRWTTTMTFRDFVGVDRGVIIRSDREASAYSISLSCDDLATFVDGIGSGEEEDMLIVSLADPDTPYPRFEAVPAWKDVTRLDTLRDSTNGYLNLNREIRATPTFTIDGDDVDPSLLRVGDIITGQVSYGPINFDGLARVTGINWRLGAEAAESRTLELEPITPASQSILNRPAEPTDCEDC